MTLQVKQGPRPAEENQQQCHCSKVELDSSNCTTELLHNHPTESRDPPHNEDNGSIPHVVVAVTQPSEGSSSPPGKDGSLLSGGRRKALVKILVVAVAVCLVGVVLVLSVYLLGGYMQLFYFQMRKTNKQSMWNCLNKNIKHCTNVFAFKKRYRSLLVSKYNI